MCLHTQTNSLKQFLCFILYCRCCYYYIVIVLFIHVQGVNTAYSFQAQTARLEFTKRVYTKTMAWLCAPRSEPCASPPSYSRCSSLFLLLLHILVHKVVIYLQVYILIQLITDNRPWRVILYLFTLHHTPLSV